MALVKFKKSNRGNPRDVPLVSLRQGRFHYNATFARLADFEKKKCVIYYIDSETREIGFEFLAESDDTDAYTLEDRGGPAKFRSSANELIKKNVWIRSVATPGLQAPGSFEAKKTGKLWVVRLCPAFEYSVLRDNMSDIPADAKGIYRYINKSGLVLYIGKGAIRRRAQEPERLEWNFDSIEYSLIENENDQFEWEAFWIDQYQEKNAGELPAYNRQGGNKS